MKRTRPLIALVVLVLMTIACGLPAGGNGDASQAGTTPVDGGQSQSPTEADIQGEPYIDVPGIGSIQLLTNVQGGGEKPLFSWKAVSDADRYQLIVFDENGEPYWAWEGMQTQVYMGGSEGLPDADSSGPSIAAGFHWAVVAYDASGQVLASSELRPISQ
jgi:hypothetical protein